MEYKVYPENETLCLTPEHKLKEWASVIQATALAGNQVILYADTETTGLEYSSRGRGIYDPVLDRKRLEADAINHKVPLKDLEKEALDLQGKIDRIIEVSFVACYKDKLGQTRPLKDSSGEMIYFHEMISPYRDIEMPEDKIIKTMPIVPEIIHKTSFEFLKGNEVHPFLNIQLPKEAPGTRKTFETFLSFFDYDNPKIFDNLVMLFHNGDEFDVPFINAEISKMGDDYANKRLRDYVKVFDTLAISKSMLPNPVQKFISHTQSEVIYGGNPDIKNDKSLFITGHHKNLDNLIRVARFLPEMDFNKAAEYQLKTNYEILDKIKKEMIKSHVKPSDELIEAIDNNQISFDVVATLDDGFVKANKSLIDEYKKFTSAVDGYQKELQEVNENYPEIMENLRKIPENIKKDSSFRENIDMINSIGRDAHGAKVDSMLFMYAMTILEKSMYKTRKIVYEIQEEVAKPIPEDFRLEMEAYLKKKEAQKSMKVNEIAGDLSKIISKNENSETKNKKQISIGI